MSNSETCKMFISFDVHSFINFEDFYWFQRTVICKYLVVLCSVTCVAGFHPVFNRKFEFDISVPELAIVEFQVMDYESISSNVLVAQCCLPFTSIMPGILFSSCNLTNSLWRTQLICICGYQVRLFLRTSIS